LPLPVGMMASTSRPARIAAMISACPSRNEEKPNTLRSSLWAASRSTLSGCAVSDARTTSHSLLAVIARLDRAI
jgi:hypothetical protein